MAAWFPGAAAPPHEAARLLRRTAAKEQALRKELRSLEQRRRRELTRHAEGAPGIALS